MKKWKPVKLEAVLQLHGKEAVEEALEELKKGAERVVKDAKENCPVQTGALSNSIHMEANKDGSKIKIVADAQNDEEYYGKVVEFSPKINKPYLYPAMDKNRDQTRQNIIEAIRRAGRK